MRTLHDLRSVHGFLAFPRSTSGSVLAAALPMHSPVTSYVLIADGDAHSRERRESQLRAAGCHVSVARTAFEAIVKASCEMPDLILIDESLPDPGAAETVRLITTCPVTSHIPIIPLTRGRRVPPRVFTKLRHRSP